MRQYLMAVGLVLAAETSYSAPANAWGKYGHLTVCDLAYRNLTSASRDVTKDLLQSGAGGTLVRGAGRMPDRRYTSFNYGCLEEDEIPRAHENDHYINVSRDTSAINGSSCPVATPDCILSGINRDLVILRNRSKTREQRVRALMALGHWLSDIHQPLHLSFADDKGGNWIKVTMSTRCAVGADRPGNLHAIWDKCLLDYGLFRRVKERADYRNWDRFTVTYRAVDTLLANTSVTEEKQIVQGQRWEWANASLQVTRLPATRYCTTIAGVCRYSQSAITLSGSVRRNEEIGADYLIAHERLAENQVRLAGFRLAHLLNQALDPGYREPTQNRSQRQ